MAKNNNYVCEFCSARLVDQVAFGKHILTHQGEDLSKYKKGKIQFDESENKSLPPTVDYDSILKLISQLDADVKMNTRKIKGLDKKINTVIKKEIISDGGEVLSRPQQKKVYALIRDLANHTGEDETITKDHLKQLFFGENFRTVSFATLSKKQANEFIDYVITQLIENNAGFNPENILFYEKTDVFVNKMIEKKRCIVCGDDAQKSIFNKKPFSLCEKHIEEWKLSKEDFIKKYLFTEYFYGVQNG